MSAYEWGSSSIGVCRRWLLLEQNLLIGKANVSAFLILIFSFCFGLSQKLADLFDEHGWKGPKFLKVLLGILWGIFGSILIIIDRYSSLVITATVLYWLFRGKLDYTNHVVAGTLTLLVSIYQFSKYPELFIYLVILFIWFVLTGSAFSYLRRHFPDSCALRLRLWIYVGPLIISFILGNFTPFLTVLFGMMGTELISYKYVASQKISGNPPLK